MMTIANSGARRAPRVTPVVRIDIGPNFDTAGLSTPNGCKKARPPGLNPERPSSTPNGCKNARPPGRNPERPSTLPDKKVRIKNVLRQFPIM
jgi:hypothetical protein